MKTKIQGIFMAVVAIAIFSFTMLTNMTKDQSGNLKFSPMVAMAQGGENGGEQPKCWDRTTSDCASGWGYDGGQRVTCDFSGTYVPYAECTPVNCGSGTVLVETKVCKDPNAN